MHLFQPLPLLVALASNLTGAVGAASTSAQPTTSSASSSTATSSATTSSSAIPVVPDVPPPVWAKDNTVLLTATNISTTTGQLPEGLESYSLRCTKSVCETAHNKTAIAFSKGHDDL